PDIADAIRDHYKPLGPNDLVPTAPVSIAVALADKLDTLSAFFAIDERPTGSGDPYALRRAALGMTRILLENTLRVGLARLSAEALAQLNLWPIIGGEMVAQKEVIGVLLKLGYGRQAREVFRPMSAEIQQERNTVYKRAFSELATFIADRLK